MAARRELDLSVERMRAAMAPYRSFIRPEQARLSGIRATLDELNEEANALREEIATPHAAGR